MGVDWKKTQTRKLESTNFLPNSASLPFILTPLVKETKKITSIINLSLFLAKLGHKMNGTAEENKRKQVEK